MYIYGYIYIFIDIISLVYSLMIYTYIYIIIYHYINYIYIYPFYRSHPHFAPLLGIHFALPEEHRGGRETRLHREGLTSAERDVVGFGMKC